MTRLSPPSPGELACCSPLSQASFPGAVVAAGPRFATPQTERATYGGEVAKLAQLLGIEPMVHHRRFWDTALEHTEGAWSTARSAGRSPASAGSPRPCSCSCSCSGAA